MNFKTLKWGGGERGENAEKRNRFGVQFPMPELKLFLSLSFPPSGQTEKNKKVDAVRK